MIMTSFHDFGWVRWAICPVCPTQTVNIQVLVVTLGALGPGLDVVGDGGRPGVAGEGVAQGGEDVGAVFGGGGGVAADGVAVTGGGFGAQAAGDFLLGFGGAQVPFGLVGGGRDAGVKDEAQHVVFAVAQVFEQFLPVLAVVEGGAGAGGQVGQPGGDGAAVGADQGDGGEGGDGGQAAGAGLVRGVDQVLQGGGDLGGPGGPGVGLGGVFEVAQKVGAAQLVGAHTGAGVVVAEVAVVDHHPGRIGQHKPRERGDRAVGGQGVVGQ